MRDDQRERDSDSIQASSDRQPFLKEVVAGSPVDIGEAAVHADAAPLVIVGMVQAGLTAEDLRLGLTMAGIEPQSRRERRPWHRWTGPLALRGAREIRDR